MELDKLNMSQVILLTLLVSFVTSIATGIVTVSLMEQGVSPVTTTVNKIVERTKEIVVENKNPTIVKKTETVVLDQSNTIAKAVSKNSDNFIIIYKLVEPSKVTESDNATTTIATSTNNEQLANSTTALEDTTLAIKNDKDSLAFVTRGVVVKDGVIIADASKILDGSSYIYKDPKGDNHPLTLNKVAGGLAILKSDLQTTTTLGDVQKIKRGQTIIVLSGKDRLKVITAVISDILINEDIITNIEIDKPMSTAGSILIDTEGNLIGISTASSRALGSTWFAPVNHIQTVLNTEQDQK